MKTLELEFEGKGEVLGTTFRQLRKSDNAFLYELTDNETCQKRYEVFEKRIQKEGEATIGGQKVKYEEKELYPKSNCFGVWAWCFVDFKSAEEKFNLI